MLQGSVRKFGAFEVSRRSVRDVGLAALAGTAAAAFFLQAGTAPTDPSSPATGKLRERLAFEQEIVPVRDTRIFDTVAMFARPSADPVAWSEEPVPTLQALPVQAPLRSATSAAVPRLVASAEATPRAVQPRPPARPADLSRKAPAPALAPEDEAREPIRVAGWSVPGSQYLPTGRDAAVTASALGRGAAALGQGATDAVRSGASTVGDALSSAGRSVGSALFD